MNAVDLIIFGAGNLSARKLFPRAFQLDAAGLLQDDLRIAAVGQQQQAVEAFRDELRLKMTRYMRQEMNTEVWHSGLSERLDYLAADFAEPRAFAGLRGWLDDAAGSACSI